MADDDLRERLLAAVRDPGSVLNPALDNARLPHENYTDWQHAAVMAVVGPELDRVRAEAVADQAALEGLTVEDGTALLKLRPPREIAIAWVYAARAMLGDAPNYSETSIGFPREAASLEVHAANEPDWYVLTVQRKGKLTPHEARVKAEQERDAARAERDRYHVAYWLAVERARWQRAGWDEAMEAAKEARQAADIQQRTDRAELAALRAAADESAEEARVTKHAMDWLRKQADGAYRWCVDCDRQEVYVAETASWRPSPVDTRPDEAADRNPATVDEMIPLNVRRELARRAARPQDLHALEDVAREFGVDLDDGPAATDCTKAGEGRCDRNKATHPGLCLPRCTKTPGCTEGAHHRGRCTTGTFNGIAWANGPDERCGRLLVYRAAGKLWVPAVSDSTEEGGSDE